MSIEPDGSLGIRGQSKAVVQALITSVVSVFALIVVVVLISKVLGLGEEESESTAASTTSNSASTAPLTTPAAASVSLSDSRCAPAPENIVAQVQAGLNMDGYRLANATVIIDGRLMFFGATTLDASGQMEERSDVWIVRDHVVFASTGGARSNSQFPKASSSPLGISPADERVRAVDGCVVEATRKG